MDKPIPEAVVRDPHHGGCNKWKWENGVLYHQSVGSSKWIKTRNVHPTPARIKALAAALTAAQQPDHLVDANKMVAQQPAAVAPRAWLCTFGEVSGATTDPKWRDVCARLGQQITPLVPAVARKPAAVALSRKYPDDGNGDDDAYNRGWNECLDAIATQHHEPTT